MLAGVALGIPMDTIFWVGIAIGGLISLLASIAANLFHSKMVSFLDHRKTGFRERRRKNAFAFHQVVKGLHEGERNKYVYMLRISRNISTHFLISYVSLAAMLVIVSLGIAPDTQISWPIDPTMRFRLGALFFLMFFFIFGVVLLRTSIRRFSELQDALDYFDEYDADFKKEWGTTPG
jgi:hypothetical protein